MAAGGENLTLIDGSITKDSERAVKRQTAEWLIEHSDSAIGYENIAVDGVGVGVGVIDGSKDRGAELHLSLALRLIHFRHLVTSQRAERTLSVHGADGV